MRHALILAVFTGALSWCQEPRAANLKALYNARNWTALHDAIGKSEGSSFYRGALAVEFHQDPRQAESLLRSVIKAAPKSEEASQAYEWLSHLYLYSGQYARFFSTMEAWWAAFPNKPGIEQEKASVGGFRGLPDQVTVRVRPSVVPHDDKSIFVPLIVNGTGATYFFDTGAWLSALGESEAKRLGLRFTASSGSIGTMTNKAAFRTAVADELVVGNIRLRNVSFAVFPDDSEPWSLLPPGQRGLLGIPVILAFQTLRWAHDGSTRIGEKPARFDVHQTNLTFDNDHLAVAANIEGRRVLATVDTGAENTDLYGEFGKQFPAAMELGKKDATEVRGVRGAESYDSVTLPELTIEVGGVKAVLRPAHVLVNRTVRSYLGNFGMDLWEQGEAFQLDFGAMTLQMEPRK